MARPIPGVRKIKNLDLSLAQVSVGNSGLCVIHIWKLFKEGPNALGIGIIIKRFAIICLDVDVEL